MCPDGATDKGHCYCGVGHLLSFMLVVRVETVDIIVVVPIGCCGVQRLVEKASPPTVEAFEKRQRVCEGKVHIIRVLKARDEGQGGIVTIPGHVACHGVQRLQTPRGNVAGVVQGVGRALHVGQRGLLLGLHLAHCT